MTTPLDRVRRYVEIAERELSPDVSLRTIKGEPLLISDLHAVLAMHEAATVALMKYNQGENQCRVTGVDCGNRPGGPCACTLELQFEIGGAA